MCTFLSDLYYRWERYLISRNDDRNADDYARKQAVAEGRAELALEIAEKLLRKGQSVEEVSETTGLSLEYVESLKSSLH